LKKSLKIQINVINALFLREVQTRFGTKKLGYFWAIFDAMLMVLIFASLKSAIAPQSFIGLDFSVFLASGFLAYFLWKNIVNRFLTSFSANSALFVYKQVKPFDTLISRFFLEILISFIATMIFLFIGWFFNFNISIQNFNMVILAVIWLSIFAFSFGLFSAVISSFYETYEKLVSVIMSPLLFISALMYTVDSLPPSLREIILYNPLVHFIEMIHGNYFIVLDTKYVDYEYMFYWTIVPLFLGLFLYRKAQYKIVASR
jgi:capsular polysaccharide transport system permease protein